MDNEFMENAAPEENTQPVAPAPKTKSVQAKPKLNKKVLIPIIAGVAVVAVVLAIVLFAGGDGNYMAPLDLQIDVLNAKTYDKYIEATAKASNGLLDDAMEDCFDVLQKTDLMEYMKAFYEENVASFEDEYGKDYKFYYETEDLEKIDKDELNNAKKQIKDLADTLKDSIDEAKENDDDDWEDEADEMGVSVAEAKKLLKAMESMYKALKSPRVTKGYEMTFVVYVEGSELDKPEEYDVTTVEVYKVNGTWIVLDSLNMSF